MESTWDDRYMLFANNGYLLLVQQDTMEVIEKFRIPCDGGDPNTKWVDNKEYLEY
jgi:hypothetical protein